MEFFTSLRKSSLSPGYTNHKIWSPGLGSSKQQNQQENKLTPKKEIYNKGYSKYWRNANSLFRTANIDGLISSVFPMFSAFEGGFLAEATKILCKDGLEKVEGRDGVA